MSRRIVVEALVVVVQLRVEELLGRSRLRRTSQPGVGGSGPAAGDASPEPGPAPDPDPS
jgi:hypothetical protein